MYAKKEILIYVLSVTLISCSLQKDASSLSSYVYSSLEGLQKDASSLSSYVYSSLEGKPKGSDIVLEAILEAEVAQNAKHFFSQPGNQIPEDIPKRCRREERGGSCIVAGVISRGEEPV
ncbi:uncharacterized protein A4U43_UnF5700 [Asparagus officinalis]|uniref:Uncharacterized protein n=1 Tax=Asparagus officinalis TaxID=4686 RepID=A0A1R3L6M4_ASPOF|nr:uncharacterized protein A4U43_UnF5700 [Asparagus officinalis]